jgi:hypothetical protein
MNTAASCTTAGTGSLQLEYLSSHEVATQSSSWWRSVLGVVGFEKPPIIDTTHVPLADVPVTAGMIRSLCANDLCEVWRVANPAVQLSNGAADARVSYRFSDDLLFGSLIIAEQAIEAHSEAGALQRATEIAYQEVFDVLNETDHPAPITTRRNLAGTVRYFRGPACGVRRRQLFVSGTASIVGHETIHRAPL